MKLGPVVTIALLLGSGDALADDRLALSGDKASIAGQFLGSGGVTLEFDARVAADGSLDLVVTHELTEIVSAIAHGTSRMTSLAGIRLEDALQNKDLDRRVRAVLDSTQWSAYRELVLALRQKIGRDTSHARLVMLMTELVESGDRFRAGAYRVPALARIPTK